MFVTFGIEVLLSFIDEVQPPIHLKKTNFNTLMDR